jgi:hypothetical protein
VAQNAIRPHEPALVARHLHERVDLPLPEQRGVHVEHVFRVPHERPHDAARLLDLRPQRLAAEEVVIELDPVRHPSSTGERYQALTSSASKLPARLNVEANGGIAARNSAR